MAKTKQHAGLAAGGAGTGAWSASGQRQARRRLAIRSRPPPAPGLPLAQVELGVICIKHLAVICGPHELRGCVCADARKGGFRRRAAVCRHAGLGAGTSAEVPCPSAFLRNRIPSQHCRPLPPSHLPERRKVFRRDVHCAQLQHSCLLLCRSRRRRSATAHCRRRHARRFRC